VPSNEHYQDAVVIEENAATANAAASMISLIFDSPWNASDAHGVSLFESTAARYAKTDRRWKIRYPIIDVVRIVTVCFRIACLARFDSLYFGISALGNAGGRRFPDIPVN
jgi:hypothetical protein